MHANSVREIPARMQALAGLGGMSPSTLHSQLDDIRRRLAHGSRVRAQLAGPRATAAVLTTLPLFGVGLGQIMGTDPLGVLRDGLLGQGLLVIGCGLTAAGVLWSERILHAAVAR